MQQHNDIKNYYAAQLNLIWYNTRQMNSIQHNTAEFDRLLHSFQGSEAYKSMLYSSEPDQMYVKGAKVPSFKEDLIPQDW